MFERAIANFRPRPRVKSLTWARLNAQTEQGRPYDHAAYPHLGAPGGPMDAFDCPQFLAIWLQYASRLGKTFFGQCVTMKTGDCDPGPMMFASADQKLAVEVTARTYRMLERCPPLRDQLRPKSRRKQDLVELADCRMFVAWARSVSTLADKAVRVGHANEIDKWEHTSTSKEADPLKLFSDRFKEFPSHKKIYESTPAQKHSSRIERGRLASTNCSYWVPCPHCGAYQTLRMGDGESPGGIRWDKTEAGKSDKNLARRTARYICRHCEGEIKDEHRGAMMRAGVWVPEGCGVDADEARKAAADMDRPQFTGWKDASWITGKPLRDDRDAGYQLSSLYALSLTWGDVASEFVDSKKNAQNLRNFINQWLAETWVIGERDEPWEDVAKRLIDEEIRYGVVPKWASLLTMSVDRQGDDRHPWVVDAWGPDQRSATIAYGYAETLEEAESRAKSEWPHEDGGPMLKPSLVLVDSGHRPLGVYEMCERLCAAGVPSLACKGSSNALTSDYDIVTLGKNTSRQGTQLCHVDTIRSQNWMHHALYSAKPKERGGFSLYKASLFEHEDFIKQLENDKPVEREDARNNARETWDRIDPHTPNDYRDCKRYSYVAMLIATRNGPIHPRKYVPPPEPPRAPLRIRELKIRR